MNVLVTGAAGFIGSHTAEMLLARGDGVRGLDSFDDYYDPRRKRANLEALLPRRGFEFQEGDFRSPEVCRRALEGIDVVVHLGARPGVRASIEDPGRTFDMNVVGTLTLLEA